MANGENSYGKRKLLASYSLTCCHEAENERKKKQLDKDRTKNKVQMHSCYFCHDTEP